MGGEGREEGGKGGEGIEEEEGREGEWREAKGLEHVEIAKPLSHQKGPCIILYTNGE